MSYSASRLPARPSLEQLRKQAKDLLKGIRDRDASALARVRSVVPGVPDEPALADAQFILAREYGFESWPALARHVVAATPRGVQRFEWLAQEVAEAYTSADVERLREINWVYGTSFVWYRESSRMHQQSPVWFASESREIGLARDDARRLVARMSGFEDWAALTGSLSAAPTSIESGRPERQAPTFYRIDRDRNSITVRGFLADQHWDTVTSLVREQQIASVVAGGITDVALDRLSRLEHVTALHIGGGELTDDGLMYLARLPGLQELSLGGPRSRLTDRGLAVLRHLGKLRRVSLCWSDRISDAGIAHLSGAHDLEAVDLMGTPTGDGALDALADKPFLRTLATGRLVTDRGVRLLQRIPRFKTWHGGELDYGLMAFQAGPTHLLLDGPFTDEGLASLGSLQGLFGLNLFWHATAFTPAGMRALAEMPRLGMLGCNAHRSDDDAMRAIATLPALRMLMVQDTQATDEGFAALSGSRTIEHIWGRETPHLTGRGLVALSSMPSLRGLAVGLHNVDDASLATLSGFPSLQALVPIGLPDDGFRHVGRCPGLESLWMMYCRDTTDPATEHITALSKLENYHAGHTRITDRSLAMLARMRSLEKIELYSCQEITDAGVALLSALPHLKELVVEGSPRVTPAAAAGFGPLIPRFS